MGGREGCHNSPCAAMSCDLVFVPHQGGSANEENKVSLAPLSSHNLIKASAKDCRITICKTGIKTLINQNKFSGELPGWSGLKHLPCEESLRQQGWRRDDFRGTNSSPSTYREVIKKTEPGSLPRCTARGGETTVIN